MKVPAPIVPMFLHELGTWIGVLSSPREKWGKEPCKTCHPATDRGTCGCLVEDLRAMMQQILAPFRGTALHYMVAYVDAVCLGAVRDMADRQVMFRTRCHEAHGT